MLSLKGLLGIREEERNIHVLELNDEYVENDSTFAEEYGALCGDEEGVLYEESLQMLLVESGIDVDEESENDMVLSQDGEKYTVDMVYGYLGNEYLDFSNIRKVGQA